MIFFITVLLVGGLTAIELPCPVCGGTGYLPTTQGLRVESVELELISTEVIYNFLCGPEDDDFRFTYAVNMLLTNEGTEPTQGSVEVVFYEDEGASEIMLIVPTEVTVAPETTKNIVRIISFDRPAFEYDVESFWATVKTGGQDILCSVSGARGKLPFVKWLRVIISK